MTGIPQAAIDAGIDAFAQVYNDPATMTACIVAAVEAAAPLIAAAERERIRQLANRHGAQCIADLGPAGRQWRMFADLLTDPAAAHPDSLTDPALD